MTANARRDRLVEMLTPVVADAGLDLEDVEVVPAGRRRLLRVVVDRDGGVGLDDVAEVSQGVSTALDSSEAMGSGAYVLEVTSPGVDRPLTLPRHWRRAAGRLVKVATDQDGELTGRVVSAADDSVVLEVDGDERRLEFAAIGKGKVQVEFRHADDENDGA
jgi:ribosome maturation factor RimP